MLLFEIHLQQEWSTEDVRKFFVEALEDDQPSYRMIRRTVREWVRHEEFALYLEVSPENLAFCCSQRSLDRALFHHPFNCPGISRSNFFKFFVIANNGRTVVSRRKRKIHVRPVILVKTENGFFNPVCENLDIEDESMLQVRHSSPPKEPIASGAEKRVRRCRIRTAVEENKLPTATNPVVIAKPEFGIPEPLDLTTCKRRTVSYQKELDQDLFSPLSTEWASGFENFYYKTDVCALPEHVKHDHTYSLPADAVKNNFQLHDHNYSLPAKSAESGVDPQSTNLPVIRLRRNRIKFADSDATETWEHVPTGRTRSSRSSSADSSVCIIGFSSPSKTPVPATATASARPDQMVPRRGRRLARASEKRSVKAKVKCALSSSATETYAEPSKCSKLAALEGSSSVNGDIARWTVANSNKAPLDNTAENVDNRSRRAPNSTSKLKKMCNAHDVGLLAFLYSLLLSSKYSPNIIKWENSDRTSFRIIKPKEVAKLLGLVKSNHAMAYDKFSRYLRYVSKPKFRLIHDVQIGNTVRQWSELTHPILFIRCYYSKKILIPHPNISFCFQPGPQFIQPSLHAVWIATERLRTVNEQERKTSPRNPQNRPVVKPPPCFVNPSTRGAPVTVTRGSFVNGVDTLAEEACIARLKRALELSSQLVIDATTRVRQVATVKTAGIHGNNPVVITIDDSDDVVPLPAQEVTAGISEAAPSVSCENTSWVESCLSESLEAPLSPSLWTHSSGNALRDIPSDFWIDKWQPVAVTSASSNKVMADVTHPEDAILAPGNLKMIQKNVVKMARLNGESDERLLWQFLAGLLHDPRYCPFLVKWLEKDKGLFQVVRPAALCDLWSKALGFTRLSYARLCQGINYYCASGHLLRVSEHDANGEPLDKLCVTFQFGPNATGWQEPPPNLELTQL